MRVDHSRDATLRVRRYWAWVTAALVLLLAVDLFTSLAAAATVGLEHERNPLMAWLLAQPLSVVVAVHLAVGVAVTGLFAQVFAALRSLPRSYRRPVALGLEAFLAVLVAVGLFAVANNVTVIATGLGFF